jgi:hypothetical protein
MTTFLTQFRPRTIIIAVAVLVFLLGAAFSAIAGTTEQVPPRGGSGGPTLQQPVTIDIPSVDHNWGSGS